ncbi:hypothetical protein MES5069_270029 [Mesorhizobium escarrei]|uniref:Uncharacterized protein n=1 Tax=Mesorhizobium escarrei TaxID=666018 RepID=A0ABM9DVM3_9HYPH|nr:hypothetical protein MES5069_270029 [Mesorhizobium escarrei]
MKSFGGEAPDGSVGGRPWHRPVTLVLLLEVRSREALNLSGRQLQNVDSLTSAVLNLVCVAPASP